MNNKVIERVKAELKPIDTEERAREIIDETTEVIQICGISFTPSRILEELDPIAFSCAVSDIIDGENLTEIDGEYYDENEVQDIIDEVEQEEEERERLEAEEEEETEEEN